MKTYWLLGNKNYSVQNDSLVCHWNPGMSQRKKAGQSAASGQEVRRRKVTKERDGTLEVIQTDPRQSRGSSNPTVPYFSPVYLQGKKGGNILKRLNVDIFSPLLNPNSSARVPRGVRAASNSPSLLKRCAILPSALGCSRAHPLDGSETSRAP